MLRARKIEVRRGNRTILRDLELEVRPGEFLALLGPNGAGKSTLLDTLSGELEPAAGAIELGGRPIQAIPGGERAKSVAFLPQESRVEFPFEALEVAVLGRVPHGTGYESRRDLAIAREALILAGVGHLSHRLYPSLSGGERQRVQLARVLAQLWEAPDDGARYLLLDEPTSSLDPPHQHAVLGLVRRLSRHGVGSVAVLHDLNLAALHADRIALLADGRIVAAGSPAQVLTSERIRQAYGMGARVLTHPDLGCPWVLPVIDRS